jgi:hypothetical protein
MPPRCVAELPATVAERELVPAAGAPGESEGTGERSIAGAITNYA